MINNDNQQYTIFGAGSIGSLFAAKLAFAGYKVLVIARNKHVQQITTRGLGLQSLQGDICYIFLNAKTRLEFDVSIPLDHIVVATKAYDNEMACRVIDSILSPQYRQSIRIFLLQNGVGNEAPYEQIFPRQNLYRLLTTEAALLIRPGLVAHTGKGLTHLVKKEGKFDSFGTKFVEALSQAGIPCHMTPEYEQRVWTKLIINAAINPLGAIYKVKNGQILQQNEILQRFEKLVKESMAILDAKPIKTSFKDPLDEIKDVIRKTANNKSSMFQDLERGKPTEIDYINGAIINLAEELGLPAKENHRTIQQIKNLEQLSHKINSTIQ